MSTNWNKAQCDNWNMHQVHQVPRHQVHMEVNQLKLGTIVPGHLWSFWLLTRALLSRFNVVSFAEYVRWYDSLSLQSKQERYNWNSMYGHYMTINAQDMLLLTDLSLVSSVWRGSLGEGGVNISSHISDTRYTIPNFWYHIHHPK